MKITQQTLLLMGSLLTGAGIRRFLSPTRVCSLAVCSAALLLPHASQAQVPAIPVHVLTEAGGLAVTTLNAPGLTSTPVAVTGLAATQTLVSIDVRPQNQELYGLAVDAANDTLQLYHLSPRTGKADAVGPVVAFTDGVNAVALPDTAWDIDFNPAVDRIRVVAVSGLNFRMNPNNGALVDGDPVAAGINPDGAINGPTASAYATAYSNSQPNNGNITTQYTLDAATNSLYIQSPPNNGTQTTGQVVTVNGQGLDFTAVSGFDIAPGVNAAASNSAVPAGFGYAVLRTATTAHLYQINLTNAQATVVADFSPRSFALRTGLSAALGLDASGTTLLRFSPFTLGTVASTGITGIVAGETLVSVDLRPATGQVIGLGINPGSNSGSLYILDPQTGAASVIGSSGSIAFQDASGNAVDLPDISTGYEMDFNPSVDRVRVVTGNGLNFRVNPNTGAPVDGDLGLAVGTVANTNTDGSINGPATGASGTAYTNSFGGTTITTQYTLDAATNALYIQNPPNAGNQTSALPITLGGSNLDFSGPVGFDILGTVTVATSNTPATTGDGFFTANVAGITSLYRVNLATGAATNLGTTSSPLSALALFSQAIAPVVNVSVVANLLPNEATLGGTVTFDGGSDVLERGIVLSTTATQANPVIGATGVSKFPVVGTTGTFSLPVTALTTGTSYGFRAYAITAAGTTYSTVRTFTPPVLAEPVLPAAIVSEVYAQSLTLAVGTTVTAKGLPAGLKLDAKTGALTGRATAPGVYQITLTAKGPNGLTSSYISTLVVKALPRSAVGTFIGYIRPNSTINGNTAGRIDVTTTSKGSYSLKVTQRTKTIAATGSLATSGSTSPSILTTLSDGTQVTVALQDSDIVTGLLTKGADQAIINGWRKVFDKVVFPASQEAGYYTVALETGLSGIGNNLIPQGTGFAAISIAEDGTVKVVGKSADGSALTSTSFLSADGAILVYAPTYARLGSVAGILALDTSISGNYADNSISGTLLLTKPATTGRIFPTALSLVSLDVDGAYLARAASGSLVLGLPSSTTPSTLDFLGAGVETSLTNPDLVDSVNFLQPSFKAVVPTPGSAQNPARTTLTLNAANGTVAGAFSLTDGSLKRAVKYQAMIVRSADGSTTARGYFLLPQVPAPSQNANATAVFSGRVDLLP